MTNSTWTVRCALCAALGLAAAAPAVAEEAEEGLSGRAAFSFAQARGNTNTQAITGEAEGEYNPADRWLYDAKVAFVTREEDNARTEERYEFRASANYYWTPDNYLYGRLEWRKDNFGGVEEELIPSIGYGRVLLDLERHSLKGEFGVGYRFAELSDGTEEDSVLLSTGLRYVWSLSESADFFQNVLVQWTSDNTYADSETGLTTTIVGNLSGRFTYRVRHNTDVPAGDKNTDFLTTLGLEYKF
ncbi:MAG: DUF481 domain-containing protein [Gammaproteobacteria bacterium]